MVREGCQQVRGRADAGRGSQHGQAAGRRRVLGGGRGVPPDAWRLRLRRGIRRRAQIPRDAAVPGGADQHQPDPVVPRRARARPAAELLMRRPLEGLLVALAGTGGRRALLLVRASPMPARASSRSSARKAISRAATTRRRRACPAISSGSTAASKVLVADIKNPGRCGAAASHPRPRRRVHPEPRARRGGARRLRLRRVARTLSTPDHRRHLAATATPATTPTMKAYDLLVQAESGLAMITGHPAGPGRVGVSVCDIACGMAAHAGVLEALIERGSHRPGHRA